MDRAKFFKALRAKSFSAFGNTLSQGQVQGIEGILDAFAAYGDGRAKTLAYGLATTRREVGSGMVPVREGFKKTDAEARAYVKRQGYAYATPAGPWGHVYYGRGIAQLTWYKNYDTEGIAQNPDKALEPAFAARLLFKGLLDGRWNGKGKGIAYYLPTKGKDDLKNARRTVNVTDHWEEIGGYYNDFLRAIEEAGGVPAQLVVGPDAPAQIEEKPSVVVVDGPKTDETTVVIVPTPQNPPATNPAPSNKSGYAAFGAMIFTLIAAAIKYFGG